MIATIKRLLTTRRALQSDTIDSLRREVIRLHAAKLAAEKWADEANDDARFWKEEWEACSLTLIRMKDAKSAAVAKGNATRKAKREAARVQA